MNRIIYTNNDGNVAVVVPSPEFKGSLQDLQDLLVSQGNLVATDTPEHIDASELPTDSIFRDAWKRGEQGKKVGEDMIKATEITHGKRRNKRAEELAPLDIQATIPSQANAAEAARQAIRDKYAVMQTNIDACTTPEELKSIIATEGL